MFKLSYFGKEVFQKFKNNILNNNNNYLSML